MDSFELLRLFDLTKQEAAVYVALLSSGELTGYEAAKLTGISRSNVYSALAGLVEKGAAHAIEGTAVHYTAVSPEEFCGNHERRLAAAREALCATLPHPGHECGGYVTIRGERQIVDRMKNMLLGAKERVYLSVSGETLARIPDELAGLVARGRKVVIITNPPFALPGATVHHADVPAAQLRLIADSSCVLTGDLEGPGSTCLYSSKKNLVDLFKDALKNEIRLIELGVSPR